MNILFICRHNVFRSRIAEAYFKKINKNKNIHASSAGLFKGTNFSRAQKQIAKKLNLFPVSKPKPLSVKLLKKQNLTIIVADDIPLYLFDNKDYNKKVIQWKIPDVLDNRPKQVKKTAVLIKKKVEELVKKLEEKK